MNLEDLRRDDRRLTQIEAKERKKEAAITRLEQTGLKAPDDSRDKSRTVQRLAELEKEQINSEDSRRRVQAERRVKITQLEIRLAVDRDRLKRTSRIVSHAPVWLINSSSPWVNRFTTASRSFCSIRPRKGKGGPNRNHRLSAPFSCRRARARESKSATQSR